MIFSVKTRKNITIKSRAKVTLKVDSQNVSERLVVNLDKF